MHRRAFLVWVSAGLQGLVALALAIPGARFLLAPLRRSGTASDFIRIAPLSSLPDDKPVRIVVSADRWDAYTHHPPGPIGSVWLVRGQGKTGEPRVRCLQTICPHLGCEVSLEAGAAAFACPCHQAKYELSGRRTSGPAPRDMDELTCRISQPDAQDVRWVEVRFEKFTTGIEAKKSMA